MPLDDAADPGDILLGGGRIHAFVVELFGDPSITRPQTYRWIDQGHLPAGRMGGQIIASKKAIATKLCKIAAGACAPVIEPPGPEPAGGRNTRR